MGPLLKAGLAAVLIGTATVLGLAITYLLQQGLDKASLLASVLGLPLAVVSAVSGVWTAVAAAKTGREPRVSGRADSASRQGAQVQPAVSRSGDIRQDHVSGPAIAHTGGGDISLTVTTAEEWPDETA